MAKEYHCRSKDCPDSFETKGGRGIHEHHRHDGEFDKYKSEDWLRQQYVFKHKSMSQIAREQNVSTETIRYQIRRHDIQSRGQGNTGMLHAPLEISHQGYEVWRNVEASGEGKRFPVHRLVGVCKYGFEAMKDNVVHHDNEIPWDNRPSNLEVMSQADHASSHFSGTGRYTEFDKRILAGLHNGSAEQMSLIAKAIDANSAHLYDITQPYR